MAESMDERFSTASLIAGAETAAEQFSLPPYWRIGREAISGYAVDETYSNDRDDAIDVTVDGAGTETLHVSISDVGSFLAGDRAIGLSARRLLTSRYGYQKVITSMIPPRISEDALSLVDNQARPVVTLSMAVDAPHDSLPTVSFNALTAQAVTPGDFNERLAADDLNARRLQVVADRLFARRTNRPGATAVVQNEAGQAIGTPAKSRVADIVVQETMIRANAAAAQFMLAHDIPAFYRLSAIEAPVAADITEPGMAVAGIARARYADRPGFHDGLDLAAYTHFTSPLRRYVDFVNHCNLVAFLHERRVPYSTGHIIEVSKRIGRLTADRTLAKRNYKSTAVSTA